MRRRTVLSLAWAMLVCVVFGSCAVNDPHAPLSVSRYDGRIRVACVGDSITFGAGIRDRNKNSYPAQLAALLGTKWEVRNFGVCGATLLKKGDMPYWKQGAFKQALAFRPHVVVLKLGTNDTKPQNWKHHEDLAADCEAMIRAFDDLEGKQRIWVCLPAPAYGKSWGISDDRIRLGVIPKVNGVAKKLDLPVLDMYAALRAKPGLFPDKIHPNADGAAIMAHTVFRALTGREVPKPR